VYAIGLARASEQAPGFREPRTAASVKRMDKRQDFGADGEAAAEKFLRRHRYTILERNYRCPLGEADLIALDGSVIVFVEVKTRAGEATGSPFDAVDRRKQRQLVRVANYYLSRHRLHGRDARFDVVGVRFADGQLHCELVRNAFEIA
jgi:putative endonuclease